MKTKFIKYTLILVFTFFVSNSFSQNSYTKKFEKTFAVNENTIFKLSNKYGKVHIETNNSDKVEITVIIIVNEKKKEKAEDIFDNIEIIFSEEGNYINALTEIDGKPSTIECKYGKLQINELLTSDLDKKAVVILKYSKGTIEKCDYLDLEVKYSGINVNESRVVNLNSGYSNIKFNKAYIMKVISKYDPDFTINEVTKLVLDGKYSGYNIGELHSSLKAFIKYSNLETEILDKDFESVFVNSKYGNIKIYVDEDASYKLNAKAEYGSIYSYGEVRQADSGNVKVTSSFIGNDENSKSKITITSKYGNINVK